MGEEMGKLPFRVTATKLFSPRTKIINYGERHETEQTHSDKTNAGAHEHT